MKKIKIRNLTSTMHNKKFVDLFQRNKVIKKLIKNNPIIFDVGACEGQTIIEMVKNFKKCTIHSFEANKNLLPHLQYVKNRYKKNFKILINSVAIGDKKKNVPFYLHQDPSQSSLLKINFKSKLFVKMKKFIKKKKFLKENNKKINVPQITLDYYCKKNKIKKIDILKSDTQGCDLNVLKGAKKILSKTSVLIVEINFIDYYEKINSFYEFEKILRKNFYFWDISMIYKNPKWGSTDFVDAIYINKKLYKNTLKK